MDTGCSINNHWSCLGAGHKRARGPRFERPENRIRRAHCILSPAQYARCDSLQHEHRALQSNPRGYIYQRSEFRLSAVAESGLQNKEWEEGGVFARRSGWQMLMNTVVMMSWDGEGGLPARGYPVVEALKECCRLEKEGSKPDSETKQDNQTRGINSGTKGKEKKSAAKRPYLET